ncbi:hypothetical protein [Streptomyces rishiriensis]|uniref:Uncharacterized protein n=1 Tax=Streptomyces rishiriensis TaxID=68264 RepID=A0ABU0P0F9_STRRH|nr:hypothetical protein [Streptomyces rishiriensis]MDQ0584887.1 hypothetical protein [Streptomyces rishiriensis]
MSSVPGPAKSAWRGCSWGSTGWHVTVSRVAVPAGRRLFLVLLALLAAAGVGADDAGAATGPGASGAAATPDRARYGVVLRADADGSHWTGRQ